MNGVVEDVGVDVQPEAVELGPRHHREAAVPNGGQVERADRVGERRAAVLALNVVVAKADDGHVLVAHEWAASVQVGKQPGTPSSRQGQFH